MVNKKGLNHKSHNMHKDLDTKSIKKLSEDQGEIINEKVSANSE